MRGDEKNLSFEKELILLSYDLRSENINGLSRDQKDEIAKLRVKIWYQIKYKYKLRIINESLYIIPNEKLIPKLEEDIENWKNAYRKFSLDPNINIIWLKTDSKGYEAFKELEKSFLLEWMNQIIENLQKSDKISKAKLAQYNKKLDLIQTIVDEDFSNDLELNDTLVIAFDTLQNLKVNGD
jgi:hypothetical protein